MLTADKLTVAMLAAAVPPPGSFTNPTDPDLLGRVAQAPLIAGQPVLRSLLAPKGSGAGLQALIPPGMRAITVDVNETSGLGGMLVPGCRVDVLATIAGATADRTVARAIVQNVLVQAVGQRISPRNEAAPEPKDGKDSKPAPMSDATAAAYRTVTLIAKPDEAFALELASSSAHLRLVLRNSGDDGTFKSDGATIAQLRGKADVGGDPFSNAYAGLDGHSVGPIMPFPATTRPEDTHPATRPAVPTTVPTGPTNPVVVAKADTSKPAPKMRTVTFMHADHVSTFQVQDESQQQESAKTDNGPTVN
jgi:pilus assembly protein CpaB